MVTAPGFGSCFDGDPTHGCYASNGGYCAYHADFKVGGVETIYANIPFGDIPGCQTGATPPDHPNANSADDTINLISHEQNESITDPLYTPAGWYRDSDGQENGDICYTTYGSSLGGSGAGQWNQSIHGGHYALQSEWSNDASACHLRETMAPAPATSPPPPPPPPAPQPLNLTYHNGPVLHTNTSYVIYWQPGPAPTATPTVSPGPYYPGHTVSFSATSNYAGATYVWSFGDGTGASGAAPAHSYATPGTYTVTVTPSFDHATGAPATQTVTVVDTPPSAAFDTSVATAKTGEAVGFNAAASGDPDGSPVTFSWDFGDGQTAAGGPTSSHSYSTVGPKTVTLTVTDSVGQTGSTTRAVTITPAHLLGGVTFAPGQTRRAALAHGLHVKVSCNDGCSIASLVQFRALVQTSRHRKTLKLIQLGSASSRLAAAGQAQLTIPFTRAAKRRLGRLRSPLVTVTLSVTPISPVAPPAGAAESSSANLRLSG
jgi:PKD repeat protein